MWNWDGFGIDIYVDLGYMWNRELCRFGIYIELVLIWSGVGIFVRLGYM